MPIYEYRCVNCKNVIEKITLKIVKEATLPTEIKEKCTKKCSGAITRHIRIVSAPAYVGLTPPATSKNTTRMSQMRQPKDPNWKARVKKGLNPEGKKLRNRKREAREEWRTTVNESFPDLAEKRQEVAGRARTGEIKTWTDAIHAK